MQEYKVGGGGGGELQTTHGGLTTILDKTVETLLANLHRCCTAQKRAGEQPCDAEGGGGGRFYVLLPGDRYLTSSFYLCLKLSNFVRDCIELSH